MELYSAETPGLVECRSLVAFRAKFKVWEEGTLVENVEMGAQRPKLKKIARPVS